MSGEWREEPAVVWDERTQKARVAHECSACGDTIEPGAMYVRHVRINDPGDTPELWKRCMRCERIYRHLCSVHMDYDDAPQPDLGCGHSYEDRHGKPPPPEIAALAFALPGEVSGTGKSGGE